MPLVEQVIPSVDTDFATLLQKLFDQKFTGAIVLNFRGGVPKVAEVPSVQIRLDNDRK